jgi:serine/threonine protein kinase/WD40 repeat protein
MVRRGSEAAGSAERDERLGEAIEAYLALAESGSAPEPEVFAASYPDLGDDLKEALEGLALVQGLVGSGAEGAKRLEAGRRIAGYQIVRELGRGGMGIVYEAVHVDLDRPVALKVLGANATPDSSGRRRFLNEAKTAAGLHHTHIVPVFDVGQVGGLCYYAMQRIEGCGLDRVLKALRRGRTTAAGSVSGRTLFSSRSSLPPSATDASPGLGPSPSQVDTATWAPGATNGKALRDRAGEDEPPVFDPPRGSGYYRWVARLGRQAAEALNYANRRGVVHRDVKPSNLLVDDRGTVWVADFGLARKLADPSQTQTDGLMGTPRYMSPEQAKVGPVDGRTDVYSLGATLYEMLTLRPPFEGQTAAELVQQITGREPASPRRTDPRIPRDLETIVLKAMAKRPADRYANALELADDLERFLKHEPVKARRIGPAGRLWRFARRHPSLTGVTLAATVAIVATATVAYVRVVRERDRARDAEFKERDQRRRAEEAGLVVQATLRELQLNQAILLRNSAEPDRRERGLARLSEAAVGADRTLKLRARNEAAEFLALRHVEARGELPVGKTWGVALGPEGRRLGVLSADGSEFSLWDVDRREHVGPPQSLRTGPNDSEPEGFGPGLAGVPWLMSSGIVSAGPLMAVVWPNGVGIRFFDAATGTHHYGDLPTPGHQIAALWATPRGHRLITIDRDPKAAPERGRPPRPGEGLLRVHLWDPDRDAAPIKTLVEETKDRRQSLPLVAVAPDGRSIATARMGEKAVALWSADDGQPMGAIETSFGVSALALGPEGQLAVAGEGTIGLWEVASNEPAATTGPSPSPRPLPGLTVTPHQAFVRALRFGPNRGNLLAVVGGGTGVEVWDLASNSLMAALKTSDRVQDLDFAAGASEGEGPRLVVAASSSVTTWAVVESRARMRAPAPEGSRPGSLAFGPDGRLAMTFRGPRTTARLWNPEHCPTTAESWSEARPFDLTYDARGLLAELDAFNDQVLRWLRPDDRTTVARLRLPESPGGGRGPRRFVGIRASAGGKTLALVRSSEILLWRADDPDRLRRLAPAEPPQVEGRNPFPYWSDWVPTPAGDRLYLIVSLKNEFHAWAVEGDRARDLGWTGLPEKVEALALSPDGSTLALAESSGDVVLVDTARGTVRQVLPRDEAHERVRSLAFSPRGDALAAGTRSGPIRVWSLKGGRAEPLIRLPGHRFEVATLAFDPSGRRLASGDEKSVDVWDLARVRDQLTPLGLGW